LQILANDYQVNVTTIASQYRGRAKMLLQSLSEEVLQASLELVRRWLVLYTFGNVRGSRAKTSSS